MQYEVKLDEVKQYCNFEHLLEAVAPYYSMEDIERFISSMNIEIRVDYDTLAVNCIGNTVISDRYKWSFNMNISAINEVYPFVVSAKSNNDFDTTVGKYVQHFILATVTEGLANFLQYSVLKIQGKRPAFGYPACPEHKYKKDVIDLLNLESVYPLTSSYGIIPETSICGLIIPE